MLHLWGATDDDWRPREDLDREPICAGAESFLAGTASCRIEVSDVDALFAELQSGRVLHDVSRSGVTTTDFGTREFAALDCDGNLLTFFRWNDGEVPAAARRGGLRSIARFTAAKDCDERGPPRWHARRVIEERARGGPRSCCTLDWI